MKKIAIVLLFTLALASRAFQISSVPEQIPESNPVIRTLVTEGRTTFSFIIPNGWIPSTDAAARKISFESTSPHATLEIRMLTNAFPSSVSGLKAQALKNLQTAEVLEEFQAFSGGDRGWGIDVRHQVNGKFTMISRINWYPAPEGVVEVSMSTSPEDFARMHNPWTGFINSFRVEKDRRPPSR